MFADEAATVYAQDLIIPDATKRNFWSGEGVQIPVHFSHYSSINLSNGRATWSVDGSDRMQGEIARGIEIQPGEVQPIGFIRFRAPEVDRAQMLPIRMQLESEGKILSRNTEEIRVFPPSDKFVDPKAHRVNFVGFDGYAEPALRDLGPEWTKFSAIGYEPHSGLDPSIPVAVSRLMNPEVEKYMEKGGSVVLLATPEHYDFLSSHGLTMVQVNFSGGINGSLFARKDRGLFDRIPFDNPMSWPFYRALPQTMLLGVQPENNSDILAGGYGGFLICKPADVKTGEPIWGEITSTLLQCRFGQGRLIICTIDLLSHIIRDPVATIMFNDLVQYARGDFSPTIRLR